MNIAVYTLTSELHDEQAVGSVTREFLESLHTEFCFRGADYSDYGSHALSLIYVRTGGTEGIFRRLLPQLQQQSSAPFYLLTSGKSNSLAASMEILSYLRQHDLRGEILHGKSEYVAHRIQLLAQAAEARRRLRGVRFGIVGEPSDWLISSTFFEQRVCELLGISLVRVPMQTLLDIHSQTPEPQMQPSTHLEEAGAQRIYNALTTLVQQQQLGGLTLRCFDLLTAVRNTGCMALAQLNAQGIVAGCEGDVPAMLTMLVAQALTGSTGFQANPASIDPETGEIIFAHCTIPLNMVSSYELDTHFESGIGVAIRGQVDAGPVTVFKLSGDLQRHFVCEGELLRCQTKPDLCRTQLVIRLDDPQQTAYFLTNPIGNHHIVLRGHHRELIEKFLGFN